MRKYTMLSLMFYMRNELYDLGTAVKRATHIWKAKLKNKERKTGNDN